MTSLLFWHPERARDREPLRRRLPGVDLVSAADEQDFARLAPARNRAAGREHPAFAVADTGAHIATLPADTPVGPRNPSGVQRARGAW